MSIAQNPLMGSMKKSMGNFTTYTLNGRNIVRSKAFMPKDSKSEKQLILRARMTGIGKMYKIFRSIINLGFPERENISFTSEYVCSSKFQNGFRDGGYYPSD